MRNGNEASPNDFASPLRFVSHHVFFSSSNIGENHRVLTFFALRHYLHSFSSFSFFGGLSAGKSCIGKTIIDNLEFLFRGKELGNCAIIT